MRRSSLPLLLLLGAISLLVSAELPPTEFAFGGDEWLNTSDDFFIQRVSNAELIEGGIELTSLDAQSSQVGAFWVLPQVYVAAFNITFTFQATPNTDPTLVGLDGLAFVIQAQDSETAIGPSGGGIGYGEGVLDGQGITHCVAVELDTFKDPAPISDPDGNHIAIHASASVAAPASAREPGLALTNAIPRLNDGNLHNVTITYERGSMYVFYDTILGSVLPNVSIDVEAIVGGPTAWLGFTGSLGSKGGDGHIISYFSYSYGGVLTPENSVVTGLGEALTVTAGTNTTFTLQTRDQYDNPCRADSSEPTVTIDDGTPESVWQYLGDGLFSISFYVTESGNFSLSVYLDGVAVTAIPLTVNSGPVAPSHCSAYGAGLSVAIAGEVSNFSVVVVDEFYNPFLGDAGLTIDFNRGPQSITPIISDNDEGHYSIMYTPAKMGSYNVAVRVNVGGALRPLVGSPFPLTVQAGPVDAGHCNTSGPGLLGFAAGTPVWFAVTARDIFNNIVPETDPGIFTVSLQMGATSVPVTLVQVDDIKGTFNASFTLTTSGLWTLQVTLTSDGKSVMGSPFSLAITSATEPSISLCNVTNTNEGLTGGAAGDVVSFTLTARDEYGNLLDNDVFFNVAIDCSSNTSVSVDATKTFQPPGQFLFTYSVELACTYLISVQYLGTSLPGSPWQAPFIPGPSSGLGSYTIDFPTHLSEKERGNFMIQVTDRFGNNQTTNNDNFAFSVSRKGHANNTYHWPFTVTPSNTTGGFYYVVFGPADKRGTFQVDVRLIAPTLEPLQASPYTIQVKWGLSALEIALIGMGLAVFVLLVMLALYLYRRVVLPWRKRRKYAAILEDSENRTPVVPKAPE